MGQRKVVLYIASSLDGYIATSEHHLDWLFSVEGEGDNGYSRFYETVDTILLGRVTYDWIIGHEKGRFPYVGKECYVFSRTAKEDNENVRFISGDIARFVVDLKKKEGGDIWLVGGGDLLRTFLNEKLVDEIIITLAPWLLGSGIPLFQNNAFPTALTLTSVRRYNQFVELRYETREIPAPA